VHPPDIGVIEMQMPDMRDDPRVQVTVVVEESSEHDDEHDEADARWNNCEPPQAAAAQ